MGRILRTMNAGTVSHINTQSGGCDSQIGSVDKSGINAVKSISFY